MKSNTTKAAAVLAVSLILVSLAAGCASTSPTGSTETYQVAQGEVVVRELPGAKAHSYLMPDSNAAHIIETESSLIVLDMAGSAELAEEFSRYIQSLGKPVSRVYLSHNHDHHLMAPEALSEVPMYTLDTALDSFASIDTTMYAVPTETVSAGTETIDGIPMEYRSDADGAILYIAFPEQKMIWTQHLLYSKFHLPMPGAPIDQRLADVEGFDYYLAGHGVPGGPEIVTEFKAYQGFVNQAIADAENPEAAISAIKAEYPDWAGAFLLESFIPAAFEQ